jgi:predicted RNA-binding protein
MKVPLKLRELLKRFRSRPTNREATRLADTEERAWVEYMPSQQDDRPPH